MLITHHLKRARIYSGDWDNPKLNAIELMEKISIVPRGCIIIEIFVFRTLVTTTILCYFLGVHDFMLVITGSLADIAGSATEV